MTAEARRWLDDLLPGGDDQTNGEDVTRVLFDAAHAVRGAGKSRATTCVRTVGGHWMRVEGSAVSIGAADVAVLLHQATAHDLVTLYALAIDKAPAGSFYFAENGENSMREVCVAINHMLGFAGAPAAMSMQEAAAEWIARFAGRFPGATT